MRPYSIVKFLMLSVSLWLVGTSISSAVVIIPTDLNAGDQYRLVFVTTLTFPGSSSDIAVYNGFVDGLGEMIMPNHDWRAIASTESVDARDNTSTVPGTDGAGIPIYRLDDSRVANSYMHLWNAGTTLLLAPIITTDDMMLLCNQCLVYTGTDEDGTGSLNRELGGSTLQATIGETQFTDDFWINGTSGTIFSDHSLYGISTVLTVPSIIPEPASIGLVAIGSLLMMARGKGRRG